VKGFGSLSSDGHASGGGVGPIGGMFSDTLEAKLWFSSVYEMGGLGVVSGAFCVERDGKGLLAEEVEKGFEKGFAEALFAGFTPNKLSPKPFCTWTGCFKASLNSVFDCSFVSFTGTSVALTPRMERTLPSLRRQVLRLHENTYSRLSCPGKNSGRSPLSCRSKTIGSLHTLHFASAAEGGLEGSSHV